MIFLSLPNILEKLSLGLNCVNHLGAATWTKYARCRKDLLAGFLS